MSGAGGQNDDEIETLPVATVDTLPKAFQEVLDAVPKENREAVLTAFVQIAEMHRGPLPRPQDFGGYEKILPGSANRIMTMAEKEQSHRHAIDASIVSGERSYGTRGQWLAGVFFALLIFAGFYVIAFKDNNIGGGIILGATTLTVVVAFLGRQLRLFTDGDDDEEGQSD